MSKQVDIIVSIPSDDRQSLVDLYTLCKNHNLKYELAGCCDFHESNYDAYQELITNAIKENDRDVLDIIPQSDTDYTKELLVIDRE